MCTQWQALRTKTHGSTVFLNTPWSRRPQALESLRGLHLQSANPRSLLSAWLSGQGLAREGWAGTRDGLPGATFAPLLCPALPPEGSAGDPLPCMPCPWSHFNARLRHAFHKDTSQPWCCRVGREPGGHWPRVFCSLSTPTTVKCSPWPSLPGLLCTHALLGPSPGGRKVPAGFVFLLLKEVTGVCS